MCPSTWFSYRNNKCIILKTNTTFWQFSLEEISFYIVWVSQILLNMLHTLEIQSKMLSFSVTHYKWLSLQIFWMGALWDHSSCLTLYSYKGVKEKNKVTDINKTITSLLGLQICLKIIICKL